MLKINFKSNNFKNALINKHLWEETGVYSQVCDLNRWYYEQKVSFTSTVSIYCRKQQQLHLLSTSSITSAHVQKNPGFCTVSLLFSCCDESIFLRVTQRKHFLCLSLQCSKKDLPLELNWEDYSGQFIHG